MKNIMLQLLMPLTMAMLLSTLLCTGVLAQSWAQRAGGTYWDQGNGIAVDGSGNVYVMGYFGGTATFGDTTLTSVGDYDIFVAKYNSSGAVQWAQRAGGTYWDQGNGIAVDGSGNVYVTGFFRDTATFGSTTLTSSGGSADIFVAKYNSSGAVQWAQRTSGIGMDGGNDIAVDGSGNVYVAGYFEGTATFGSTTLTSASGSLDIFVAKYNSSGAVQWAQRAGGIGWDGGNEITVDGSGNVYVTGFFKDTATFGSTTLTSGGSADIFVAKYNSSGAVQWAQRAGDTGSVIDSDITVDSSGNLYVTGYFWGGTAKFGDTTLTSGGSADIFVAKYNSSGAVQWAQRAGGTEQDQGSGIAVDGSGNVYVTGYFEGTATFGSTTLTSVGGWDIFVAKYNSSGVVQWAQRAGGATTNQGYGIAVDGSGNIYVTGYFWGTATFGSTTLTSASGWPDIFVAKYAVGTTTHLPSVGGQPLLLELSAILRKVSPNPTRERMTVSYDVVEAGEVRLSLYNAAGAMVCPILRREHEAGSYEHVEALQGLSSGVYFVVLESGGRQMSMQFEVVK